MRPAPSSRAPRDRRAVEFGDFQTPRELADRVAGLVAARGMRPQTLVEPTCGRGVFVDAAFRRIGSLTQALALDVNRDHLDAAKRSCTDIGHSTRIDWLHDDFFAVDWKAMLRDVQEPILMMGNPPWVTAAVLGALGSGNFPPKSNFQGHRGLDARTGKANFDIAEWMLIHLIESFGTRRGMLAMLVKTAVARRVIAYAWKSALPVAQCAMYEIDAKEHFNVSASACLLLCEIGQLDERFECDVFELVRPMHLTSTIGWRDSRLVADVRSYDVHSHFRSPDPRLARCRWRSGIKHDCARVMELRLDSSSRLRNGFNQPVDVEEAFVYPMLKGSDVARGNLRPMHRRMIVTQQHTADDTNRISETAPRTWKYLESYGHRLDRRASSIYRNRPRFAMFGVGSYAFAPWKVAIAGLYKRLEFRIIRPHDGRPVVVDDTVYFVPCNDQHTAERIHAFLRSDAAQRFLCSLIFFDAKRPITIDVLSRIDLDALYVENGSASSHFDWAAGIASDGLARPRKSRVTGER